MHVVRLAQWEARRTTFDRLIVRMRHLGWVVKGSGDGITVDRSSENNVEPRAWLRMAGPHVADGWE